MSSTASSLRCSVVGDELFLYGGVDSEETYVCATGLYVFSTGIQCLLNPPSHIISLSLSLSLSLSCAPFPIATRTWERRETTGPAPKAQNLTAVHWEGSLILFGGVLDGLAQNTTHILNIGTCQFLTPPLVLCL